MAREASTQAVRAARVKASEIGLVAAAVGFGNAEFEGDDWRVAPFRLAQDLGADRACVLGIQQMSNGGAAALEYSVAKLLTESRLQHALVVSADAFAGIESFPMGNGPGRVSVADGAAAALLTNTPETPLRIRSLTTCGIPGLELMPLGESAASPTLSTREFSLTEEIRYFKKIGPDALGALSQAVNNALEDADVEADDPAIERVLLPRLTGSGVVEFTLSAMPAPLRTRYRPSPNTGHLGPGDLLAELADLCRYPPPAPGLLSVLVSGGFGFSVTCVVVEATAHAETTRAQPPKGLST
ncbi:hypothetical protein IPZ58_28230 [Streptomyces roseoverticillatus]|uniref:hypothetical protein n=1 Tax=Streptomyces roseoverticillatus TaxID=66429 RepID=UPI001F3649FE|nr:hypothetical protein [Streptomyces roseoverticillatus]MCF3105449.1 hypothetical protein [Streptomyces roseoverticillatus]